MSRPATARLFIALDLPPTVRSQLAAWARSAVSEAAGRRRGLRYTAESGRIRLLEPESMHLTICFLGSLPVEEIEPLGSTVARCARPLGECSLGAPLWLPPRRPRALAVEVHDDSGALTELHADVLQQIATAGTWAAGERHALARPRAQARQLRPHITVARMGAAHAPHERALPPTPRLFFVPERLTLYRSHLGREGASYETLASCEIPSWASQGTISAIGGWGTR